MQWCHLLCHILLPIIRHCEEQRTGTDTTRGMGFLAPYHGVISARVAVYVYWLSSKTHRHRHTEMYGIPSLISWCHIRQGSSIRTA